MTSVLISKDCPCLSEKVRSLFFMPAYSVLLMVILSSCGIVAPAVQPFEDYNDFMVLSPVRFVPEGSSEPIVVPVGFVTDYASIPGLADPFLSRKNKRYQTAAVIHDWLYWNGYDRRKADDILYQATKHSGVTKLDSGLIWAGVRIGGDGPWLENQKLRQKGYLRIIPEGRRDPTKWPGSWPEYRQQLYREGLAARTRIVSTPHAARTD